VAPDPSTTADPAADPAADAAAGLWAPHRRLLVTGIVCLITVVALEAMAVTTVMPLVEEDLGGIAWYGWAFSAFYLGDLVGIVLGGRAADRTAPVVPLLVGVATFAAGLLVGGLAPSMPVLVLGRLMQGLGAGVVPAVAYVCVARGIPAALHPRIFAVMSTSWVLPSLVSPLAASAVATSVGWRWVFLGLVPVTAAVLALAVRARRRLAPPPPGPAPGRHVGAALRLAAGAGLLLAGLSGGDVAGAALAVGGAVVLVPALVALTPEGTLRARRGMPAAILTRGVLTMSYFSATAFVSLALTQVRGASTLTAGLVLGVASLTWTAGSWLQARTIQVWGPARLERLGGAVLVIGLAGLAACLAPAVPLWCWFAASAVAGGGIGTAYSPLSVVTLAGAVRGREGAASSALQLTDVLGVAVGTGLAGVVVAVGDRLGADPARTLTVLFLGAAATGLGVVALSGRLVTSPPG
jgi:MFS family permease